jgi:serine/threonine-protein kinase
VTTVLAGRYRLERRLASGGMGDVWRATDTLLERPVAVKLLREALAENPVVAERFRREALTAASLSHPNMAGVFDYLEEDGRPGIVMEMVDGETLAVRLAREGLLEIPDAVAIAIEVLAALAAAHEAGVVHRDVKPGNVMLTPRGEVKVTDFGIARAAGDATLTESGFVIGTAHYTSPEQVQGHPATAAADLYGVGVLLYECLTGNRPFDAETPVAAALKRLTEDPPLPRSHRRDIPGALEAVVLRALARDPLQRHGSAAEMANALAGALAQSSTAPMRAAAGPGATEVLRIPDEATVMLRRAPGPRPARRRPRVPRGRAAIWLAAALVLLTGGFLVAALRGPVTTTVPSFTGKTADAAITLALRAGIDPKLVTATSRRPAGEVIAQSIAPGATVKRGATVTLTLSTGPPPCCAVPRLSGLTAARAEEVLSSQGLRLGEVRVQEAAGVEPGTVLSQGSAPGTILSPGSNVDIVIAKAERKHRGKGND